MSLFEFNRDDFSKVIEDPRFIEGVKLAVEENFFPSKSHFRGDPSLLEILKNSPRDKFWDLVKDYPLPYISPCEDPETYARNIESKGYKNVKQDVETRQMLLDKAKDKLDPAWWCYIHQCESLALFILYPICRILFPDMKLYLYDGELHKMLINKPLEEYKSKHDKLKFTRDLTKPCIFDLVSQLLEETSEFTFFGDDAYDSRRIIPSEKMMEWYIKSFSYTGMDVDKLYLWFNSL